MNFKTEQNNEEIPHLTYIDTDIYIEIDIDVYIHIYKIFILPMANKIKDWKSTLLVIRVMHRVIMHYYTVAHPPEWLKIKKKKKKKHLQYQILTRMQCK